MTEEDWPNNPQLLLDRDILQDILFGINRRLSELEEAGIQDLVKKDINSRLKTLEEWKKYHAQYNADFKDIPTVEIESYRRGEGITKHNAVVIDKGMWEHIVYLIEMMNLNWHSPEDVKRWLTEALDAVKKVEP